MHIYYHIKPPLSIVTTQKNSHVKWLFLLERVMGIGPTYFDWQPNALPLCYTRLRFAKANLRRGNARQFAKAIFILVPRERIGLSTTAFSEQCSTTELPRQYYLKVLRQAQDTFLGKCGRCRTRTCDPLSVNEMLYQLS